MILKKVGKNIRLCHFFTLLINLSYSGFWAHFCNLSGGAKLPLNINFVLIMTEQEKNKNGGHFYRFSNLKAE